jgi:perosamine synthetase
MAAALGLVQLKRADEFHRARKRIAELYHAGFADVPEIRRPVVRDDVQHAWHLYVMQLELDRLRIGRDEFIEALKRENIGTSVHFIPLHLHPFYKRSFGYQPADFPNATAVFERIISLPIFPGMGDEQINRVINAVRDIARQYRR